MAKTTTERHMPHVKDIFAGSVAGKVTDTDQTSYQPTTKQCDNTSKESKPTQPTTIQASNSDVFFMTKPDKPQNTPALSAVSGNLVGSASYVRRPSSSKKRPAPKPPDNKHDDNVSEQTNNTQTGGNTQPTTLLIESRKSSGSNETTGHHLDRPVISQSEPTTHIQTDEQHFWQHSVNETTQPGSHVPARDVTSSVTTGKNRAPEVPKAPRRVSQEQGIETFMNMSNQPHTPDPGGDLDSTICATSCLSDSGTASSSSGYQSEDVLDQSKPTTIKPNPLEEAQEDERFEEEECTLDFDEEDETYSEGRSTLLYKEYQGEDFAHYLKDDLDPEIGVTPVVNTTRKQKHRKKKEVPVQSSSSSNSSTMENSKKKGFKDRFNTLFTSSKHKTNQRDDKHNSGRIGTFSFADSKIGVVLGDARHDEEDAEAPAQGLAADAGFSKSWWNTDTLSARTLRNNNEVMTRKKQRSSSASDILDGDYSNANSHAYNQRNFESYRKSQMYSSSGKSSTNKTNLWSKITRTLRRKDKPSSDSFHYDNTAINPLASDAEPDTNSDVHL